MHIKRIPKSLCLMLFLMPILQPSSTFAADKLPSETSISNHAKFIGTWEGTANTSSLCHSKTQNSRGEEKVVFRIERPKTEPLKNNTINIYSGWGCFSEMALTGFIFDDEFLAASNDRLEFVKIRLQPNGTVSGEFRMDLNGLALKMDFQDFRKSHP